MASEASSELLPGIGLNVRLRNFRASMSTTAQAPFPHNVLAPWPESLGDLDDDGAVDDSFAGLIPDAVRSGDAPEEARMMHTYHSPSPHHAEREHV